MSSLAEPFTSAARVVLPRPTRKRYQPIRAGICNIWEYDDQEFWFHDGRLILRGANEAGKSKALELLLPFLLDADLRPQRLDPFGEKSKTMFWNLLAFDPDRTSAIGYCWLEFGRVDDDGTPHFVTIGAGMRATKGGNDVKPWYFVTKRRLREDVSLLDGRTPLTHERLANVLGKNDVFTVARDYRGAVDRALFDLGPDRYAALIHLMLQLRRPHLSDKLDPDTLSAILTESLPPLDETRITQLASAFDSLDAEAEALATLEGARDAVVAFRDEYRTYARLQSRKRAAEVRSAVTKFDAVTKRVRQATEARDTAQATIASLDEERDQKKLRQAELEGRLRGLEDSDEMQDARRLDGLKQTAAALRDSADRLATQHGETSADLTALTKRSSDSEAALARAGDRRTTSITAAARAAESSKLTTIHDAHVEPMKERPDPTRAALDSAIQERLTAIGKLRPRAKKVHDEELKLGEARRIEGDLVARREQADTEHAQTSKKCEQEQGSLAEGIERWAAGLDGSPLAGDVIERLVETASAVVIGGQACTPLGRGALADEIDRLHSTLTATAVEIQTLEARQRALTAEREKIASERDDGPRARAGRATDRSGRPGGALWELCDYAGDLPAASRAAIEAALEAAGLLDAWITPDGLVVDPDTLDTLLIASDEVSVGHSLADVLVATPSVNVPEEVIRRVLRQIAIVDGDPDPTALTWISTTGRWRIGPLRGRWSKDIAEHIGAGTRAATRARRLATIDDELRSVELDLGRWSAKGVELTARRNALEQAATTFPSGAELLRARAALDAAAAQVRKVRIELEKGQRDVVNAGERARRAQAELTSAATDAGLLDALEDLDGRVTALEAYRRAIGDLAAECNRWLDASARRAEIGDRRDDLARRVERQRVDLVDADRLAQAKSAEASALEERVGASVAEIIARRDEVSEQIKTIRKRLDAVALEVNQANKILGTAESELTNATEARTQRENERAAAMEQLAFVGRTELLALAVPDAGPPLEGPPWPIKSAVELARRIESKTSDVSTDESATDRAENRTFTAFNTLRTALGGDFDPALSKERDLLVISVRHNARVLGVIELGTFLDEEVAKRRELLERDERAVIEKHLLGDVGLHLQERVADARRLIDAMTTQLAAHPTNSGITVRLRWVGAAETDDVAQALRLLQRDLRLLVDADQNALVQFLRARIAAAREAEGAGSSAERIARALDYRHWHKFEIRLLQDGTERVMTKKLHRTGSGGSKAVLVHLPLFAAASAHYKSARPEAPHLIMLDEAFDGVDSGQRGSCMGLLAQFDLDFVITNYQEWGCYEELPGVAAYNLSRIPSQPGVAALRFVWDGFTRREDDPFADAQLGRAP